MTKLSKTAQPSLFPDAASVRELERTETKIKDKDKDKAPTTVGTALVPVPLAAKPTAKDELERLATSIFERLKNSSRDAIKIGNDLITAKSMLGHGKFQPWIKNNFGMSERTAERYMALATRIGSKSDTLSDLPLTILHKLAASSTPDAVIEIAARLKTEEPDAPPAKVRRIVNHELRALKARTSSDDEQGGKMAVPSDAFGTAPRALPVTTGAQAGGAEQEAAQLIASRLGDELPRLIELLGNSDLSAIVRHLNQLTSRELCVTRS
jgi:hypothetical protein